MFKIFWLVVKYAYKLLTGWFGACAFGGLSMIAGIFLTGVSDAALQELGILLSGDTAIVLAIGAGGAALGGVLGFRNPILMAA